MTPSPAPRRFPLLVAALLCPVALGGALCGDTAPKSAELLLRQKSCVDNIEMQDYARAETNCDLCLEFDERDAECLNGKGLISYYRGDIAKAREWYNRAARENNDFAQPRNNLGAIEFNELRFEEAARYFEQAIEIDPRYLAGRYNLALSYLRLGQRSVADGKDPTPWYTKAETHYRRIFELYPEHADSYGDMGVIMSYRAEKVAKTENDRRAFIGDAEQYYTRCLELDNADVNCRGNLAHLLLAIGRFDESLFHFVQCLAVDKGNITCATEIKQAYAGSQMKSEALRKYVEQLVENPGYGAGHYGFCIALFQKGLIEEGVTECENALKLDNTLCLAHYTLATHYKKVLDKDLALENCRGLIRCAGETKHPAEVEECKEVIAALEVQ